ncbi:MFS transporter [Bacillus sp. M6-12]|nr:MFS transporter [Bacillus sp. M6-12]
MAGIILVAANLRPAITAVGPLIGSIRTDLGLTNGFAGLLTTIPLIGFAIISFLIPKIGKQFGNEWSLFAGLIILFCGMCIRSISSVPMLYIGSAFIGIGIAVCNVLLPGLIKSRFPAKVGLMTSVYSTVLVIFAGLGAGLSVPLAQGFGLGWEKALFCWAILTVIAVLLWLPQLRVHDKGPIVTQQTQPGEFRIWHSSLAWQVTLFMGLQSFGFFVTVTWLPDILLVKGLSIELAGWMISLLQFIGVPFTFITPVIAGRLKDQRIIPIVLGLFFVAGYGGLLVGKNVIFTFIWIFCIGIALGGTISYALVLLGMRAMNAQQAADLSGMAQSVGYVFAAIGPFFIGFLYDLTHSWTIPLIIILAVGLIMTIAGVGSSRNEYV